MCATSAHNYASSFEWIAHIFLRCLLLGQADPCELACNGQGSMISNSSERAACSSMLPARSITMMAGFTCQLFAIPRAGSMHTLPLVFKDHGSAAVAMPAIIKSPSMTVATVAALSVVATVVESAAAVATTSAIIKSPSESAATAAALSAMTSTVSGGNGGGGGGGSIWLKVTQTKLLLSTVRVIPTLPLVCFHCPSCCRQRSQCRGRS